MILPVDDSITLPVSDDGAMIIDSSNMLVSSLDDAKALLPAIARKGTSALRDAFLLAWAAMVNAAWAQHGFVLEAGQSPRFCEGVWLDLFGALLNKPRVAGELDPAYRARLMIPLQMITPAAIKAAVDALVNPTGVQAVYVEPATDAAFMVGDTTWTWASFLQPDDRRLFAIDPTTTTPAPGAYLVPDAGAEFWVVIPGTGTDDASTTLLEQVAVEVERRKACGVPWLGFFDPLLVGAL